MSGTTLADRMVAAADRFPTIDALVLFQPSRRDAHAAELAAKIPQTNPPFDVAATAAALADRLPPGCPQPEDFRNPRFGCLTTKVLLPLDPDHPAQCVSRIQLYDGIEWMIHVYGWPTAAGHAATARRLFHLLCGDAASSFLGGRAKGDTPLQSWLIDLAESDPHKLIVDCVPSPLGRGRGPWLPGWRPARPDDPWWAVRLASVLDVSAKAVRRLASAAPPHESHSGKPRDPTPPPSDPFADLRRFTAAVLKGQEAAVVEALCAAGGSMPLPDLAVVEKVEWTDPVEGYKSARRRLTPKLKKVGWRLQRHNNAAQLVRIGG